MASIFGITPQDIAARTNNLLINDRSVPTAATVELFIEEAELLVLSYLKAKGIVAPFEPDTEVLLKSVVYKKVTYETELSRNRASTSYTQDIWARCREMLDTLQRNPAYLGGDPERANMPASGPSRAACHKLNKSSRLLRAMRGQGEL